MARFSVTRRCPLSVQFWLYGLDAQRGDLTRLGYRKSRAEQGSSYYSKGALRLHSAGLCAQTGCGLVEFQRRTGQFYLNGKTIPAQEGHALIWPLLMAHEQELSQLQGQDWRDQQLASYKLPAPIRRNVGLWREYMRPVYASWKS